MDQFENLENQNVDNSGFHRVKLRSSNNRNILGVIKSNQLSGNIHSSTRSTVTSRKHTDSTIRTYDKLHGNISRRPIVSVPPTSKAAPFSIFEDVSAGSASVSSWPTSFSSSISSGSTETNSIWSSEPGTLIPPRLPEVSSGCKKTNVSEKASFNIDNLPDYHPVTSVLNSILEDSDEEDRMEQDGEENFAASRTIEMSEVITDVWLRSDRVPPLHSSNLEALYELSDYSNEVYENMRQAESKPCLKPKYNYMSRQTDITYAMRAILVDWLIEVGEEYSLQTETVYLALQYIDRFLSYMSVQRSKLQLVGTACMFIASKFEEIYPPELGEFCYITDDTYTKKQVLRMEQLVLKVLNFNLTVPTTYFFVNQFAKWSLCDETCLYLAQYLSELSLLDSETFLRFSPSIIGAASVCLARHTYGVVAWSSEMVARTGYAVNDFKLCLVDIHAAFKKAPQMSQQATREKYRNEKYNRVSEILPIAIC